MRRAYSPIGAYAPTCAKHFGAYAPKKTKVINTLGFFGVFAYGAYTFLAHMRHFGAYTFFGACFSLARTLAHKDFKRCYFTKF